MAHHRGHHRRGEDDPEHHAQRHQAGPSPRRGPPAGDRPRTSHGRTVGGRRAHGANPAAGLPPIGYDGARRTRASAVGRADGPTRAEHFPTSSTSPRRQHEGAHQDDEAGRVAEPARALPRAAHVSRRSGHSWAAVPAMAAESGTCSRASRAARLSRREATVPRRCPSATWAARHRQYAASWGRVRSSHSVAAAAQSSTVCSPSQPRDLGAPGPAPGMAVDGRLFSAERICRAGSEEGREDWRRAYGRHDRPRRARPTPAQVRCRGPPRWAPPPE